MALMVQLIRFTESVAEKTSSCDGLGDKQDRNIARLHDSIQIASRFLSLCRSYFFVCSTITIQVNTLERNAILYNAIRDNMVPLIGLFRSSLQYSYSHLEVAYMVPISNLYIP